MRHHFHGGLGHSSVKRSTPPYRLGLTAVRRKGRNRTGESTIFSRGSEVL